MSSSRCPNPKPTKKTRSSYPPISNPLQTALSQSEYSKNRVTGLDFTEFIKLNIAPERFVKSNDFGEYNLEGIFKECGLDKFISARHKIDDVHPEILAMFYANIKREGEKNKIVTYIHRVQLIVSIRELEEILELPYSGMRLEEVEIENDKYKEIIAKSNSPSKVEYKYLTSLGKIISRIVSYNILPKTGSYTHISNDQFKAMYAIVKHIEVNWARVIYEIIKTKPSHFLSFPKTIIKLLKANKISLSGKGKTHEKVIDYSMIKRMGLDREDRDEEDEENPETPMPSNTQPSSSTT